MVKNTWNILPGEAAAVKWNPGDPGTSLNDLLKYVEQEATRAIQWYFDHKRGKRFVSRAIQFLAIVLTATAGILPILGRMVYPNNDV
jgi:SMODS and SLOG-associating 2TM effector domain 2